jgi:hypothetical protein
MVRAMSRIAKKDAALHSTASRSTVIIIGGPRL